MHEAKWMDLSHATVVVTGAATGIGAAVVEQLIAAGARVHTLDVAAVSAPVVQALSCDLGDQGAIDRAIE